MAKEYKTVHISALNVSDGPRGINTVNGTVMVLKGASADLEVSEHEYKSMQESGNFTIKEVKEGRVVAVPDAENGRESRLTQHDKKLADLEKRVAALEADNGTGQLPSAPAMRARK